MQQKAVGASQRVRSSRGVLRRQGLGLERRQATGRAQNHGAAVRCLRVRCSQVGQLDDVGIARWRLLKAYMSGEQVCEQWQCAVWSRLKCLLPEHLLLHAERLHRPVLMRAQLNLVATPEDCHALRHAWHPTQASQEGALACSSCLHTWGGRCFRRCRRQWQLLCRPAGHAPWPVPRRQQAQLWSTALSLRPQVGRVAVRLQLP